MNKLVLVNLIFIDQIYALITFIHIQIIKNLGICSQVYFNKLNNFVFFITLSLHYFPISKNNF